MLLGFTLKVTQITRQGGQANDVVTCFIDGIAVLRVFTRLVIDHCIAAIETTEYPFNEYLPSRHRDKHDSLRFAAIVSTKGQRACISTV